MEDEPVLIRIAFPLEDQVPTLEELLDPNLLLDVQLVAMAKGDFAQLHLLLY